MMPLQKERVRVTAIDDKYINALIEMKSRSLPVDLALLVLLTRFEEERITEKYLSELLQIPEAKIRRSMLNLEIIKFIKNGF